MALYIVIIEQAQRLCERRLQSRITPADVQRVAVVLDVYQIGHRRLRGIGTVGEAQLADIAELIAEVGSRRDIGNGACGILEHALVVLGEARALRDEFHTDIQLIGFLHDAQHDLAGMDVVAVCRVAAQIAVAIVVQRCIAHQCQLIVPSAITRHDIEEVPPLAAQVESATVALGVFVLELIGKLQVGLRQDGLAVGGFHIVVPVLSRRHGIAVGLIGIARRHLVIVHRVVGKRATHAFAVVGIEVHHDVAPPTVQLPVDLQIACNGLGVAVADAVAKVAVLHQSGGHQLIHLTGL